MLHKESLKHIQKEPDVIKSHRSEFQTVRLFAILGALTLMFVLMIRFVQSGTIILPQRIPTSSIEILKPKK